MSKHVLDELQTCMDVIRGLTVSLENENEPARIVVRDLLDGVQAAQSILSSMFDDRPSGAEPVNLVEVLERAIRFARGTCDLEIHWQLEAPSAVVSADPGPLWDVFLNLVLNAFEANATALTIRLDSQGDTHQVEIEDNANGVPEHLRKQIFDSGFSTKGVARGTGLTISRATIEDLGGSIELGPPRQSSGARFIIKLPALEIDPEAR